MSDKNSALSPRRAQPGFTMIEALVSIVICALFATFLWTIFITSMNLWRKCSLEQQTFPPAYIVLDRLNKELRNACAVRLALPVTGA